MDIGNILKDQDKYGTLLSPDIKIYRKYFEEMVSLIGIKVVYFAPRPGKHYTLQTEIKTNFQDPEVVGVIFDEYPSQKSMKKMGWVSELQEGSSLISVPYDLHDIQVGALFAIPSGLDHTSGRLFRVTQLTNTMVYPASITCEIVPEYENTLPSSKLIDQTHQDFNLLRQEGDSF